MQQILLAIGLFCASSFPLVALAQTTLPETTRPAPARLTPVPTTQPDGRKYARMVNKLDLCKAQVAAIKGKRCDLIFVGDSITEGWLTKGKEIWNQRYVPRHALDFGVSGDQTQHVLWRLDNMGVADLKPKVAVIMIGTNNTGNTPQEIADGVKAVIQKVQGMYPGIKVILVSITPNRRANEKMMAVNAIIRGFDDQRTIFYLDLVPLMPPVVTQTPDGKEDTNWKGMSKDHLHPDAEGYQIWADAMEPLLAKLLPPDSDAAH